MLDHENTYLVLMRKADWGRWEPDSPNFQRIEASIDPYSVAEQMALPGVIQALKPDVVHFTAANTPLLWRGPRVVTIHDLTLLDFDTTRHRGWRAGAGQVKRAAFRLVFWNNVRFATHLLTDTHYVAKQLVHRFQADPKRVTPALLAADILGTVAASMVSLAALVLTITMVVVQLAMGQFSPRIVQRILQDKPSQLAIGIFVGTFAHAMLALREVQTEGDGVVPGLAVVVAFVLVVVSIMMLVWYVDHIGRALRVSALIELVGEDTRKLIDKLHEDHRPATNADPSIISAPRSGVVTRVDHDALVRVAQEANCVLKLRPSLGEFVPAGAPLLEICEQTGRLDADAALRSIEMGPERTLDQDMAYGLRLLVDIGERSLSDGPFQDPTTAVQAIDRLHDCLRQLATRPFPDGRYCDSAGESLIAPS